MAPPKDLFILKIIARLQETGLNQAAGVEIYRVHVGVSPLREVGEPAIGLTTLQYPCRRVLVGLPYPAILWVGQLTENVEGVEASVNIPVGLVQVPGTIFLLVAEDALNHCFGFRCRLAR